MGKRRYRSRFSRRPVSSSRWWVGLIAVVVLGGLLAVYATVTRPERIRRYAERFLEDVSGGEVQIDAARFDLFEGIHLTGVSVAVRADPAFYASSTPRRERELFTARALHLKLNPFALLTGDLLIPEITALEPRLRLVRDPETGMRNWQLLTRKRARKAARPRRRPLIRLRAAEVTLAWTETGPAPPPTGFALDVLATSDRASPSTYDVRWRTRAEPVERGRFLLDMSNLTLRTAEGGLPTIPIASIRWAAPLDFERWLALLDLKGQVRTDNLAYDPVEGSRAEIQLRNASLAVPLSETDRETPRDERYLNFRDVTGRIAFENNAVNIDVTGDWRGGRCELDGRIFADLAEVSSLDDVGMDIHLDATDITLPAAPGEGSDAETRFVNRFKKLKDFYRDFDPAGRVDLSFSLLKEAGSDAPLRFGGGRIVSRGASAAYHAFPYRLYDVTGAAEIAPDGAITLDLAGRRGAARVRIKGSLTGAYWAAGVQLAIEGHAVALDDALRDSLSQRFQKIWDRFAPRGRADLAVELRREEGEGVATRPWQTHIVADLRKVTARYDALPLAMTGIAGQVEITNDRFEIRNVHGRHRAATWRIDGTIDLPKGQPARVDLTYEATGLPLDAETGAALPARSRQMLESLHLAGRTDLRGTLTTGSDGTLTYDLTARAALERVQPEWFPLPLTDAALVADITPERIAVEQFTGRYRDATVRLRGERATDTDMDASGAWWIETDADLVPLTQELSAVLPPGVQRAWASLQPAGRVDVSARIAQAAGATADPWQYDVTIRPHGLALCPRPFPVEMAVLDGVAHVTPGRVEVAGGRARLCDGTVGLDGCLTWDANGLAGDARIDAVGIRCDDRLRRALPWRVQRMWNAIRPTGRFDCALRNLAFQRPTDGPLRFTCEARIDLNDVDLTGAGSFNDLTGSITARLEREDDTLGVRGRVDLDTMRFGDRLLTDVRADLLKPPDATRVRLDELEASIYGGLASGFAEITAEPDRTKYGFSVAVRNMSLPEFLAAGRPESSRPVTAEGVVHGNFFLSGIVGDRANRRGGGTVQVEHAQVMKIPLLLAIVGVLNLAPPDENAFHDGTADFTLTGDTLALGPIDLRGTSISLVGAGQMNTATSELDLTLLAGSPHRLPRFGLLTELAEAAAHELMELRVRGPLDEPRVEARPLRSLQRTVETIRDLYVKKD
jgi:hypothetical protein